MYLALSDDSVWPVVIDGLEFRGNKEFCGKKKFLKCKIVIQNNFALKSIAQVM